jgi:hypothetical protein
VAITEADVEQFLEALRQNAELRERAREVILADDFLALPRELARLTSEVAAFAAETRARFAEIDQRFEQIDQRFDRVEGRLDKLSGDVGNLVGSDFERRYRENLSARLGRRFRRIQLLSLGESGVFDEALEQGVLSPDEWDDAVRLDLVVRATPRRPGNPGEEVLAMELSQTVDSSDVERAHRRAELLRRIWPEVLACVDGDSIEPTARAKALELGVEALVTREANPNAA